MKSRKLVERWARMLKVLRPQLIQAVKANEFERAQVLLNRIHSVIQHQHACNVRNGYKGAARPRATLEQVINDVKKMEAK